MTDRHGLYQTPGEVRPWEVSYVREQARVWRILKAAGTETYSTVLEPACFHCAAYDSDLHYQPHNLSFVCKLCGRITADGSAGRLVRP